MPDFDAVIIGGGPSGLTAGIYLTRGKYRTLLIEKEGFGGQLTKIEWIENYPGFQKGTDGPGLASEMLAQAVAFGPGNQAVHTRRRGGKRARPGSVHDEAVAFGNTRLQIRTAKLGTKGHAAGLIGADAHDQNAVRPGDESLTCDDRVALAIADFGDSGLHVQLAAILGDIGVRKG